MDKFDRRSLESIQSVRTDLTTGQVAKICKVAPRTVSKWVDGGVLKAYKLPLSDDRRIPLLGLIDFLIQYNVPVPQCFMAGFTIACGLKPEERLPRDTYYCTDACDLGWHLAEGLWDTIIIGDYYGTDIQKGLLKSVKNKMHSTCHIVAIISDYTPISEFDDTDSGVRVFQRPIDWHTIWTKVSRSTAHIRTRLKRSTLNKVVDDNNKLLDNVFAQVPTKGDIVLQPHPANELPQ